MRQRKTRAPYCATPQKWAENERERSDELKVKVSYPSNEYPKAHNPFLFNQRPYLPLYPIFFHRSFPPVLICRQSLLSLACLSDFLLSPPGKMYTRAFLAHILCNSPSTLKHPSLMCAYRCSLCTCHAENGP